LWRCRSDENPAALFACEVLTHLTAVLGVLKHPSDVS
jgi:hypothetical protein